jgi:hypothetical protein
VANWKVVDVDEWVPRELVGKAIRGKWAAENARDKAEIEAEVEFARYCAAHKVILVLGGLLVAAVFAAVWGWIR